MCIIKLNFKTKLFESILLIKTATGIEPIFIAYETIVLPINYTI